jgi:hypothetical protein
VKPEHQPVWDRIRDLALGLGLAGVEETTTWGQPAMKAHGKLWVWWSPQVEAPVFKVDFDEREVLLEALPERFFIVEHYRRSAMVLMRPDNLDFDWAKANLMKVWLAQAPKRVRQAFERERGRRDDLSS